MYSHRVRGPIPLLVPVAVQPTVLVDCPGGEKLPATYTLYIRTLGSHAPIQFRNKRTVASCSEARLVRGNVNECQFGVCRAMGFVHSEAVIIHSPLPDHGRKKWSEKVVAGGMELERTTKGLEWCRKIH